MSIRSRRKVAQLGGTQGITVRQLTGFLVAMVLAFVMVPVGSWAAQSMNVFLTDPANQNNRAHVDASGNLLVRGGVTVDNLPATQDVNVIGGSIDSQVPVAASSNGHIFNIPAGQTESHLINPMNVSLITVNGADDDQLFVDLAGSFGVLRIEEGFGSDGNVDPFLSMPLTQPLPVDSLFAACFNPVDNCVFKVQMIGV